MHSRIIGGEEEEKEEKKEAEALESRRLVIDGLYWQHSSDPGNPSQRSLYIRPHYGD